MYCPSIPVEDIRVFSFDNMTLHISVDNTLCSYSIGLL